MLRREIVGRVNKHVNAMYPYTGEYIIDRMSMNGELTPNIDNVLDKAKAMYVNLCNGNKEQMLDA